jgi:hypothetical protein
MGVDKRLIEFEDGCVWKKRKERQNILTLPKGATGEFPHDERMAQDTVFIKENGQFPAATTQMLDPERGID